MKLASNVRPGISVMVRALGRGAVLALLIVPVCGAPALAQSITVLASADNLGTQLSNQSSGPSISADGRFVAFVGGVSTNLTGGCTGGILVRDLALGTTTCVASGSNPVISGNGLFVVFQSTATNLDPACANMTFTGHTFVRDIVAGTTQCVSVDVNGAGILFGSRNPSISGDGRFVAFTANASLGSMIAAPCTAGEQLFIRDLMPPAMTTCASVIPNGLAGGNGFFGPSAPSLSTNGRVVAFQSDGSNLTTTCTTGEQQVYARDLDSGMTECVSRNASGMPVGGTGPKLSGDGRFVLFGSSGLTVGFCLFGQGHAYVRERATGATTCASLAANGSALLGSGTAISGDGRFVAFGNAGFGNNPALTAMGCPLSGSNTSQVFVRDLLLQTTRCVSGDQSGAGEVQAGGGVLSGDGQVVAFQSDATNLVAGDLNQAADVFVNGPAVTLTVTTQGAGTVTSAPAGISCGADCAQSYLRGTIVTLAPGFDPGRSRSRGSAAIAPARW